MWNEWRACQPHAVDDPFPRKDAGLAGQGESTGGELEASHLTQREAGWLSQQQQGLAKLANASQLPIISASLPFSLIYLDEVQY